MSQATINALKGPIDTSFDLLNQFIDVCPDDLWGEKNGGWLIWQQVYHAIGAVDFFIAYDGEKEPPLAGEGVSELSEVADSVVSKDKVKAACAAARGRLDQYLAALKDEDLAKRNEGVFANAQWDISHAGTLSFIAAHNLYHLGSCDAALRNRGLKGVF